MKPNISLRDLMIMPKRDVMKHVTREQLINKIRKSDVREASSACNYFSLNPKEIIEVIRFYDKTDPVIKLQLIGEISKNCPIIRNRNMFYEFAFKMLKIIMHSDDGKYHIQISRLFSMCLDQILNDNEKIPIDLELIRSHGHLTVTKQVDDFMSREINSSFISLLLINNKITDNELNFIIENNTAYLAWYKRIIDRLTLIPEHYHDTIVRNFNRMKLLGKL